jgi:hypothetical protein
MKRLVGIYLLAGALAFASCGRGGGRDGHRAGEEETNDTIYILENDTIPATGTPPATTPVTPAPPGTQPQGHELRQGQIQDDPAVQRQPRRGDDAGDVPVRRGAAQSDTLDRDVQEEGQQQVPRRRGG